MSEPKTRNIIWTQARVAEVVAAYSAHYAQTADDERALSVAARIATDYATPAMVAAKLTELGLRSKPAKLELALQDETALRLCVDYATDLAASEPERATLLARKMRASMEALLKAIKDGSVGGGPVGKADAPEAPALDLGEPPVLQPA